LQAALAGERDMAQGMEEAAAEVAYVRGQLEAVTQVPPPPAPRIATHCEMFEDV